MTTRTSAPVRSEVSTESAPYCFRSAVWAQGLQIDYLRVACGNESTFSDAWRRKTRGKTRRKTPRGIAYLALGEWDVVTLQVCSTLWGSDHMSIVQGSEFADSVLGCSGFVNYLWRQPINTRWQRRLTQPAEGRPTLLASLRFRHWSRQALGLGLELLLCEYLERRAAATQCDIILANGLGWYDATVVVRPEADHAKALLEILSSLRYLTLADLLEHRRLDRLETHFPDRWMRRSIFAATYSQLLTDLEDYADNRFEWGDLLESFDSARVLVRSDPVAEVEIREHFSADDIETLSEFGRYSMSSAMRSAGNGGGAESKATRSPEISDIFRVRKQIADAVPTDASNFTETCTVLRFEPIDPPGRDVGPEPPPESDELGSYQDRIRLLLDQLSKEDLFEDASEMTRYRFAAVLFSLVSHLGDPVRGPVARHIASFVSTRLASLSNQLSRREQEDLCHLLEYALSQATDGLIQFQHDAPSAGLTGRGGYSRLIDSIWLYVRDFGDFTSLPAVHEPLLTFGLTSGHEGSASQYRIDVPFSVTNVVSRWFIILHELGHIAWQAVIGDYNESLARYRAYSREIHLKVTPDRPDRPAADGSEARHQALRFLRVRAILDEIYPQYLVAALVYEGDLGECLRMILRNGLRETEGQNFNRKLLTACVTGAILKVWLGFARRVFAPGYLAVLDDVGAEEEDRAPQSVLLRSVALYGRRILTLAWWQQWLEPRSLAELEELRTSAVDMLVHELPRAGEELGWDDDGWRVQYWIDIIEESYYKDKVLETLGRCLAAQRALAREQWDAFRFVPEGLRTKPSFRATFRQLWSSEGSRLRREIEAIVHLQADRRAEELLAGLAAAETGPDLVEAVFGLAAELLVSQPKAATGGVRASLAQALGGVSNALTAAFDGNPEQLDSAWRLVAGVERFRSDSQKGFSEAAGWSPQWLANLFREGEVMANCPLGPSLSMLMQRSRQVLRADGKNDRFKMRVQLTALLSMWHRSTVSLHRPEDRKAVLERLLALDLVKRKKPGGQPRRTRT
ncbi:MAG: hypothetical protein GY719_20220 [bacterium]|nr:hypothetical protein [bacterium]